MALKKQVLLVCSIAHPAERRCIRVPDFRSPDHEHHESRPSLHIQVLHSLKKKTHTTKMTQYDNLGATYNVVEDMAFKTLEISLVEKMLKPHLSPSTSVIEFACGSGLYTRRLLSWGVTNLTSMDISPEMLKLAEATVNHSPHVRFVVADGTKPTSLAPDSSEHYFDFGFGGWFLNYALSKAELTGMFKTIALNLKPGSYFAGVIPHPTEDLQTRAKVCNSLPMWDLPPRMEYMETIDDGNGWRVRISLDEKVNFLAAHMKKSVYEAAARDAGFEDIQWLLEELPKDGEWWDKQNLTDDVRKVREENAHFGRLLVRLRSE